MHIEAVDADIDTDSCVCYLQIAFLSTRSTVCLYVASMSICLCKIYLFSPGCTSLLLLFSPDVDMTVCSATASEGDYTMTFNTHYNSVFFTVSAPAIFGWVAIGVSNDTKMVNQVHCTLRHSIYQNAIGL